MIFKDIQDLTKTMGTTVKFIGFVCTNLKDVPIEWNNRFYYQRIYDNPELFDIVGIKVDTNSEENWSAIKIQVKYIGE